MDFGFSEDQEAMRKSAREVLEDRSTTSVFRAVMEDEAGFDEALWKTIAEIGWCGVAVPESEGGLGLGWIDQCILLEETGRAILPAPYLTTVGLALPVLLLAEAGEERSRLLSEIAQGGLRVTLAADPVPISFEPAGDGLRVRGVASFVPDAQAAGEILVAGSLEGRTALCSVAVAEASITHLKTLDRTRRLSEVSFDGAAGKLLDTDAGRLLERARDRSAVALAAEQTGIAQRVLEMTVDYAKQREQFGKAIGSFQAVSHKLAEMLLLTESARSSTYYAAWALEEGTTDASLAAATARVAGIEAARFATAEGIQIHGGIGFTWEHDLHLFYRRAKWDELFLGDASIWRERIAGLLAAR